MSSSFQQGARLLVLVLAGVVLGSCGTRRLQAVTLAEPLCETAAPTPLVDKILFGDPASESAHALISDGTVLLTGAFGARARRITPAGPLSFQLAANPNAQNYLTVKLWGGDADPALLFLYVGDVRVGRYQGDMPELDVNDGEPAFPDRFVYVTYPVPRDATAGRISVPLKLDALGGVSLFAPAGPTERALDAPTRAIYAAYLHTDPFFVPPSEETQGESPRVTTRPGAGRIDGAALHQGGEAAVDALMQQQVHGDQWNAALTAGRIPAGVLGLFAPGATPARFSTAAAWRDWAANIATDANGAALSGLAVMAMAHRASWSAHHDDADILVRVTEALDSLALMQGTNGAFTSGTWVGAPARLPAAGSATEGSGTKFVGRAFLLLSASMANAGILDALVDDDATPSTDPVTRRQAWAEMFVRHRDFLGSAAGRSPDTMYDQSQVEAFWSANESVRLLAPARALSRALALATVRTAVGLSDRPGGGRSVSPRGIPLEPRGTLDGGYDGRWGMFTIRSMCTLAQLTEEPDIVAQCRDAIHAIAPFLVPSTADGFLTIRAESVISTVVNRYPGFVEYGAIGYPAAVLNDEVALETFRLRLVHGVGVTAPGPSDGHFSEDLAGYLQDLPALEKAAAMATLPGLPPSPPSHAYRLPMDAEQPDFAWADAAAGNVAVRNCGEQLYAALNWRRGFDGDVVDLQHARVNNIARVHLTRDRFDRIATVVMESPFGFGHFYIARYGPYTVGMNLSSDSEYELPAADGSGGVFDLVLRRSFDGGSAVVVPPGESRVTYRQQQRR